jgi:hypothetical protein
MVDNTLTASGVVQSHVTIPNVRVLLKYITLRYVLASDPTHKMRISRGVLRLWNLSVRGSTASDAKGPPAGTARKQCQ